MARASLGSLIVSLGLDAVEFFTGLTKAEFEAKKFAASLESGMVTAAKGVGVALGSIGLAAGAAVAAIEALTRETAAFKDLETKTGASAESLASFAIAAGTTSTSMEAIADSSVKLTKNLVGVDDESKAAGAALTALGIPIKEFKALDPAAQLEAVAKAMGNFGDGAGKTAVALALWGKAGAAMLPFIKELNEEGGRQVILTQQQIDLAAQYTDAQKKATAELRIYAQALIAPTLPAVVDVTNASKGFILALLGVDKASHDLAGAQKAIGDFADSVADKLATAIDIAHDFINAYVLIFKTMTTQSTIEKAIITGNFAEAKQAAVDYYNAFVKIVKPTATFTEELKKTRAARQANDALRAADGFSPGLPQIDFNGPAKRDRGGGRAERQSDAERYLASLQKQQDQLEHLSVTDQFVRDLQMDRLKDVTHAEKDAIFAVTQAIDATKAQQKAEKELKDAIEERARAEEQTLHQFSREADSIQAANDALAEEVMLMGADEKTRNEFAQAQLQNIINRKEEELLTARSSGEYLPKEIELLEKQIQLYKDRQGILAQKGMKQALLDDAAAAKKYNDIFVSSFTDGLASIVDGTKSVSQAFKDMEKSIVQAITRIAAQKIAESIFGGATGGGGGIGSWLASLFGGGGMSSSGGGFGEHFAGGGFSRGGFAMVGERGPEMVRLPRGAQVIPNDVLMSKRAMRQTVNINVAGGVTSKTADQIAVQVGRATRRAIERNA